MTGPLLFDPAEIPYRLLAENASDVVVLVAPDDTFAWVSPAVSGMLGWEPEDLVGRQGADFVHADDLDRLRRDVDRAHVGDARYGEYRVRCRDGSYRWLEALSRPLLADSGELTGRVLCFRDVEDQVAARAVLAESEERFRLAMDNSAIGMCLVSPDGVFERVNGALCTMLGRDPDNLVTRTWQELTHPDDLDVDLSLVAQVLDGRRESYRLLKRFLRTDGTVIWGDLSVSCVRNEDRTVRYFVSQIVDVSDQMRARDELIESEARYRMLAENSSDIVFQLAPDDSYVWVSPSVRDILGWDPEEMVGRSGADYIHPDDFTLMVESRSHPRAGVASVDAFRFRDARGGYRWMSGRSREITNPDGVVVGRVVALRDVDELVAAQRRLQAEQQRLEATVTSLVDPHVMLQAVRDESGVIVDFEYLTANDAACAYNNMTRDQLVGARLLDVLPSHAGEGVLALYASAVETGVPIVLDDHEFTNTILSRTTRSDVRGVGVGDALSLTWRDVTDRHRAAEVLAASEQQYRLLAENSSDVVLHRRGDHIIWVSPSLTARLGWEPAEWVGQPLSSLVHPDDRARLRENAVKLSAGLLVQDRYRVRSKDTGYHWIDTTASQFHDADGRIDGVVSSLRVVDRAVELEHALERKAHFDDLTGVLKRDEAIARLIDLIARPTAPDVDSAVLFCDIDEFKTVNDTWGHQAGDVLLSTVADRIRQTVRGGDVIARLGGDEFLVVLDGLRSLDEAIAVAEKIRDRVAQDIDVFGVRVSATMSIGVALVSAAEDADSLIALADAAMYRAKEKGRNQVIAAAPLGDGRAMR